MKHIKFPSIEQFRNVVQSITSIAQYVGYDELNNKVVFDETLPLPTLTLTGTVKLHGTNAGVSYSKKDGIYAQSRENVITINNDNAGFAFFIESRKSFFQEIFDSITTSNADILDENGITTIFGEFCGSNIQKGVAINGLPKMFVIFALTHKPSQENSTLIFLDNNKIIGNSELNIYNINEFQQFSIDIDFSNPSSGYEKLNELTLAVETECPVGKAFGNNGTGEGIVWKGIYKNSNFSFKVKGEEHSKTKAPRLKSVDSAEEQKKIDFANYATPSWRLEQAWQNTFGINNEKMQPNMKEMGNFLKLVHADVVKEEMDELVRLGLEPKSINGYLSKIAREWFITELNSIVGL